MKRFKTQNRTPLLPRDRLAAPLVRFIHCCCGAALINLRKITPLPVSVALRLAAHVTKKRAAWKEDDILTRLSLTRRVWNSGGSKIHEFLSLTSLYSVPCKEIGVLSLNKKLDTSRTPIKLCLQLGQTFLGFQTVPTGTAVSS